MAYRNTTIYFMSGTGNSYRVATWMGEIAEKNGSNTDVFSAKNKKPAKEIKNGNDNLIGIVFPAHGFTMPWHILKFVWRLPRRKSTHAFCVAARGSLKFGSVFIPGMSGSGTFIVALILKLKGYNVRGLMSVDMPSNWFSLHPIQRAKSHDAIIARAHHKVKSFIERIFLNGNVWFTLNNLYEITGGILLSLISIGYLFFGRFFLAKLFFANNNCNGCGVCTENCSFRAIKMWGKKNPKPFWKYSCESCMRCSALCPQNAIEAGQSWGVILYFITAIPVSFYIFSALNVTIPGMANLKGSWIRTVLDILYYYPAIFIPYYMFHFLIRIPVINWIFAHTTMTHYYFWGRYREPNTKLTHIDEKKK
ncbi:MAG: (4Fe-4S)-binding protein [Candidatus Aminicenantes bacterium]|nr:(4Fe-4S)-binding protein [Candidatus Aminicenantes bacterium]NIM79866.1 (4Fe-4S)-binding protein [Candidatus Aminicenantes bacterium]NIN19202.1 (4Fe-4S)-binding protein [Candidatus Aminicenantes bacterium]NIN43107.1 (4Fe-4S)-binding protein [Candidatus Aminicenantes bacterium]NIN85844.1 (4Fe-4S)-binding protein [Candidatus Aminicenantes bacterium]